MPSGASPATGPGGRATQRRQPSLHSGPVPPGPGCRNGGESFSLFCDTDDWHLGQGPGAWGLSPWQQGASLPNVASSLRGAECALLCRPRDAGRDGAESPSPSDPHRHHPALCMQWVLGQCFSVSQADEAGGGQAEQEEAELTGVTGPCLAATHPGPAGRTRPSATV